jgi:hypothetical protein
MGGCFRTKKGLVVHSLALSIVTDDKPPRCSSGTDSDASIETRESGQLCCCLQLQLIPLFSFLHRSMSHLLKAETPPTAEAITPPQLLLECLTTFLRPTILFKSLPSALQLAAHISVLACTLREQCARILTFLGQAAQESLLSASDDVVLKRLERIGVCARREGRAIMEILAGTEEIRALSIDDWACLASNGV